MTFFLIDLVIHFIYFFYYTLTIRPIPVTHLIYNSKPKLNPHFHPFEILTIQSPNCLMGTKVGLALKILCKFQLGQLQDQEPRRSMKQCKDWCNPLGMKLARAQQSKWVWKKENQFWSTWYKLWKTGLRFIVWAYCYWRVSNS